MQLVRNMILLAFLVGAAGCSPKYLSYDGPEVTHIVVQKADRRMYLLSGKEILRTYRIDLGFAPDGDKKVQGDGKTPEGRYMINRRNPNSEFYLSLGISYPNVHDIAEARRLGKHPGGDIFIHGEPRKYSVDSPDWTWGCIAVKDGEIRDIYRMVKDGTPITINP